MLLETLGMFIMNSTWLTLKNQNWQKKLANQKFDQATRAAMQKLAQGQSADEELSVARDQLARLADLYETLARSNGGDEPQGG